jgi:hypothetical protein
MPPIIPAAFFGIVLGLAGLGNGARRTRSGACPRWSAKR